MDRQSSPPKSVFDVQGTLRRLGDDEELLSDMIEFFVEDAPPLMAELQAAVNADDAPAAQSAAHALKGLILGCGGVRAGQFAQRAEDAAAAGDLDTLAALVEVLAAEVDLLLEATLPYRS